MICCLLYYVHMCLCLCQCLCVHDLLSKSISIQSLFLPRSFHHANCCAYTLKEFSTFKAYTNDTFNFQFLQYLRLTQIIGEKINSSMENWMRIHSIQTCSNELSKLLDGYVCLSQVLCTSLNGTQRVVH